MNAPRDASFDDYMAESMKDPVEAAAYIKAVMELDDPAALLVALRHVAKAHGMAEVARLGIAKLPAKGVNEPNNGILKTTRQLARFGKVSKP